MLAKNDIPIIILDATTSDPVKNYIIVYTSKNTFGKVEVHVCFDKVSTFTSPQVSK